MLEQLACGEAQQLQQQLAGGQAQQLLEQLSGAADPLASSRLNLLTQAMLVLAAAPHLPAGMPAAAAPQPPAGMPAAAAPPPPAGMPPAAAPPPLAGMPAAAAPQPQAGEPRVPASQPAVPPWAPAQQLDDRSPGVPGVDPDALALYQLVQGETAGPAAGMERGRACAATGWNAQPATVAVTRDTACCVCAHARHPCGAHLQACASQPPTHSAAPLHIGMQTWRGPSSLARRLSPRSLHGVEAAGHWLPTIAAPLLAFAPRSPQHRGTTAGHRLPTSAVPSHFFEAPYTTPLAR